MQHLLTLWRERPHALAIGIIALTTVVRLLVVASGQLDLVQDEAQYWTWSRRLQLSYYSKGPLIAWIIAAGTSLFGDIPFGVRIGAVAGAFLSQAVLYLGLARLMARPRLAVVTLFIMNTTPLFLASGILMTTDNPLLVCWLAALFSLHAAALRPDSPWPWIWFAASMALGVLAKYTMLGMAGIAVLHALGLMRLGILPRRHWPRLAAFTGGGALVGLLPIVVWNAQNGWASFRHVGRLAGVAPAAGDTFRFFSLDYVPDFVGGQVGLIYPWWLAFMIYGGVLALRSGWLYSLRPVPAPQDVPADPEAVRSARESVLFSAGFWPIFLFFFIWSFHTRIYANWPAMCYASGLVLAAQGVETLLRRGEDASGMTLARRLLPLWVGLSLVCCVAIHAQEQLSRVLPVAYNPAIRLKGWSDLGRHLGELRAAMPNPDRVFFFSDQYDVASELAFYVPGQPVTYCADFGRRFNQFDFWPGPEDKKGWDAIFVRRKPFTYTHRLLHGMFTALGQPMPYASTHRGAPGREFGVMVVHGFTGTWPKVSKGVY